MAEKPILFNTEMIKATLDGRKTQTRRVMKLQPDCPSGFTDSGYKKGKTVYYDIGDNNWICRYCGNGIMPNGKSIYKSPYYVGDILWVRETWTTDPHEVDLIAIKNGSMPVYYKADYLEKDVKELFDGVWRPSIHMPCEAARIFLKVTGVRVERLQDISEEDAIKEGVKSSETDKYNWGRFSVLWNSTIKKQDLDKYGWEANPFCWVIEFERVEHCEEM